MRRRTRLAAAALILLLLPASALASGPKQKPPGVDIREVPSQIEPALAAGFDLLVLRPLSLGALCLGSVFFVPAAALSALDRPAFDEALELFVLNPAKNTFTRPLGDFRA